MEDLSVVCGASDTGKSFIVETIDFMLGGSPPLRDIPQRVGYDRIRLQLRLTENDEVATLERSVDGGGFRLVPSVLKDDQPADEFILLKEQHKHERVDNISGWLLSHSGLLGRRIRKNKSGATNSLSFRNVSKFILADDTEIIERRSPFQSGQYTTATLEYATLRLLLTGIDDGALVDTQAGQLEELSSKAKLEVLDTLIADIEDDLADVAAEEAELNDQYQKLGNTLEGVQSELDKVRSDVDDTLGRRRALALNRSALQDRVDEISDLLARFDLLSAHYKSDTLRLEAIREAGTLFAYVEAAACPLCGTPPGEQDHAGACDGDVASVVAGAEAELRKIDLLSRELAATRAELTQEQAVLVGDIRTADEHIRHLGAQIETLLTPALSRTQGSFRDLADKRASVARSLDLYRRLARLRAQREDILDEPDDDDVASTATSTISKAVLDQYSTRVEALLTAWHFPSVERVYFDESARDFVIGGKPRGSYGKGFRAITHAAVKIALMEHCLLRKLPHPGFVIVDSPLLAYWKPEGPGDSLEGSDLKERFYDYLRSRKDAGQVIVIENEHPPEPYADMDLTIFTRNPADGRYGLFPPN